MTYTIAVANEKGGVAKTTSTLSLGASLVENGQRTLLIDLDAQANLSLALGVDLPQVRRSITNVLLESAPVNSVIQETNTPGLDLIPSHAEMSLAERFLPIQSNYEQTLTLALSPLSKAYDFILLDCPPSLGAVTLNSLLAARLLLIPTQAEYFSIYALRNMMNMVKQVRKKGNSNLTYRLLLTMFDRRNRIHRTLCEQLRTTFGEGVMQTVIEVDTKLRESAIAGIPILNHAPKSRASLQYRALAQEIIAYAQETITQPA